MMSEEDLPELTIADKIRMILIIILDYTASVPFIFSHYLFYKTWMHPDEITRLQHIQSYIDEYGAEEGLYVLSGLISLGKYLEDAENDGESE